jgi:hypothetical protein
LLLHLGCAALLMALLRGRRATIFSGGGGPVVRAAPGGVRGRPCARFRADVLCLFFSLAFLNAFCRGPLGDAGPLRRSGMPRVALWRKRPRWRRHWRWARWNSSFRRRSPARAARTSLVGGRRRLAGFFALWAALPTELQAAGGAWNGESLRFPETLYSLPALWARVLRLLWCRGR